MKWCSGSGSSFRSIQWQQREDGNIAFSFFVSNNCFSWTWAGMSMKTSLVITTWWISDGAKSLALMSLEGPLLCHCSITPALSMKPMCLLFFQPISNADFIVPVEIDGIVHQVQYRTPARRINDLFSFHFLLNVKLKFPKASKRMAVIHFK